MKTTCPYCGSTRVARRGSYPKQRYQCTDKKHPEGQSRYFYFEKSPARVLLFDIETLPGKKYFWRLGDQDWNINSIIEDWIVLSWSAKWLFEPKHKSSILTPKEIAARDDKRIVQEIWNLLDQADVVIAHNGQKFDIVKLNWRFVVHGMVPPSPSHLVDTRAHAGKIGPTSMKMDWLAQKLGYGHKNHTDLDLWVRCDHGEKQALKDMRAYNERDVYILEDIYVTLRPWLKHPNMSLYVHTDGKISICPHCASDHINPLGDYYTDASVFASFRCENCGAVGRSRKRKRTSSVRLVK